MDAILIVDMQVGLLEGAPKHDLPGVLDRINRLTAMIRAQPGSVIWVQHCGRTGDAFAPESPGWALLPELQRDPADITVRKTLNDAFAGTDLQARLEAIAPDRVLIAGWATDFCVDATIRSAVSNNHDVVAIADAHTLSDRRDLDAATAVRYHNWVWGNLITHRSIRVAASSELLREAQQRV